MEGLSDEGMASALRCLQAELPKQGRFRTVYLNAGMILFVLLCIADTIANLFL